MGLQTIVFNIVLLLFVMRTGGVRYAVRTITGFVLFGFFTDLFVPLAETFADAANDLMLSALWGGIISGLGYGLVFRAGTNTGGSDTIAQIISRKTSLPVGATWRCAWPRRRCFRSSRRCMQRFLWCFPAT